MNITWGFINASQQTPKNNEGEKRKQEETVIRAPSSLGVYSASACQRRRLLITPRLGSPLCRVAGETRGGH